MAAEMKPVVADISHHNEVTDWNAVLAGGIQGIIHKATQGTRYIDPTYASRKLGAMKTGLLWGAYHFADGQDGKAQADHFLNAVGDPSGVLLCLDWEDNPKKDGSKDRMSYADAVTFCKIVYERTGQRPVVYGGNTLKELIPEGDEFFGQHRLWLCQYGPRAVCPRQWSSYWLWQYTGDGIGMPPHSVKGIRGTGIDLNVYGGSWLSSEWACAAQSPAVPAPIEIEPAPSAPAPPPPAPVPVPPVAAAPAPIPAPLPTSKEMRKTSRKFWMVDWIKGALGTGTVGFATFLSADSISAVKHWADVVKGFAVSYGIPVMIILLVLGYVATELIQHWMKEDAAEGRYTPSGAGKEAS